MAKKKKIKNKKSTDSKRTNMRIMIIEDDQVTGKMIAESISSLGITKQDIENQMCV